MIAKICWELIEALISLWKVRDWALVFEKVVAEPFRSRFTPDRQVRTDTIKRTRPILRVSNLTRYFPLESFRLQAYSQLLGMKYIHSGQKTRLSFAQVRFLTHPWFFSNSFSRPPRSETGKPTGQRGL